MVDLVGVQQRLELDKVIKAGDFFRNNASVANFPNRSDNPIPPIADRVNNVVGAFQGFLTFPSLPVGLYQTAFTDMINGVVVPRLSMTNPAIGPVNLGDMIADLDAKFDTAYPPGDTLRAEAEQHRDALKEFWTKVNDPQVIADVQALLSPGPVPPTLPPSTPGGPTP